MVIGPDERNHFFSKNSIYSLLDESPQFMKFKNVQRWQPMSLKLT